MFRIPRSLTTAAIAALSLGGIVASGIATPASAAGGPPWGTEAASVGSLNFYNAQGQRITGGNLTDQPLAAYIEGTTTIRSGDNKATLFAYTPVNGVSPGGWSGEQVSTTTVYPNGAAPGSLATDTLPVVTGGTSTSDISR